MQINVYDNLASPGLFEAARAWLLAQSPIFGWRAHAQAPGTFWHRNFVLPGTHQHHYDDGAWNSDLSYESFLKNSGPFADVAEIVRREHFGDVALTRVWANFQTFGDESAFHRDFPAQYSKSARTAIWYPVMRWDRDWGGDFVTLDEEDEVSACTLIKPNRLVVFNGTHTHAARPISRYCNELRIAVSFGCEVTHD